MSPTCSRRLLTGVGAAFLLVLGACTGGSDDTTTTTLAMSSTSSPVPSTTTTTTEPAIANGPALVVEGDNNETVAAFQFLLNCNGYGPLEVDGVLGPATLGEIQAMQADLGREVTGAPDEETLALLSRTCSEDRRVTLDEAGEQILVGNVAAGDSDRYFVRAEEGQRLAVVVTSEAGTAVAEVRGADGSARGPGPATAWAADATEDLDYVVEIASPVEAVTYAATVSVVELDVGGVDPASDGTMVLGEIEEEIGEICLDTTGDSSYVAATESGFLVVTSGAVGRHAVERGGIGASIEVVLEEEGSPGYHGFPIDFQIDVGDRVEGTGIVFRHSPGASDEPVGLAFSFERSAAPCDEAAGTPIVLSARGIGVADFGAGGDETLDVVRAALIGASPTVDSGWVAIDSQSNEYGICRQSTTEVRVADVDNLTLYFSDAATSFGLAGTRHFVGYTAFEGIFPLVTSGGVGPGSRLQEVLAAHPDAVAAVGPGGGVEVFISSPPNDDRWLRATAADAAGPDDLDAVVTSVTGGRFCDL